MAAFLASDWAVPVAWLLVALGAGDLLAGWLWLRKGGGLKDVERALPRFRRFLPAILLFDVALLAAGLGLLHHLDALPRMAGS